MTIASTSELRAAYREPNERAGQKVLDRLDEHSRNFIALSPFCILTSVGADGLMDTSPRGDPPGFVAVLDERTLLVPDRPGQQPGGLVAERPHEPRRLGCCSSCRG